MNILNSINITKMPNIMVDFKRFLKLLSPKNQLHEINSMINQFNKSNCKGENINKKFCIWNELRTFKKEIMINQKEHLQNHYSKLFLLWINTNNYYFYFSYDLF